MKYSDFFMKATKDINFKNVTTNDIEFAYDIFYKKFGYEPKEALESVTLLNWLSNECNTLIDSKK